LTAPVEAPALSPSGTWPLASRYLALGVYAETGSFTTASRETGIPRKTIEVWANSDDGANFLSEVSQAIRVNYAHCITGMVGKALRVLDESLARGDPHVDKYGRVTYVPLKAKDAAVVASILIDKHALITGGLVASKASSTLYALADKLSGLMAQANKLDMPDAPAPTDADPPVIG
jgi:hypothetical protein